MRSSLREGKPPGCLKPGSVPAVVWMVKFSVREPKTEWASCGARMPPPFSAGHAQRLVMACKRQMEAVEKWARDNDLQIPWEPAAAAAAPHLGPSGANFPGDSSVGVTGEGGYSGVGTSVEVLRQRQDGLGTSTKVGKDALHL